MHIITAYSANSDVKAAADEIKKQFGDFDSKLILYFASSTFDQESLSLAMKNNFEKPEVFGCSTSGELVSGKMLKHSVVAMAMNENVIEDAVITVIENIKEKADVPEALGCFEKYYGQKMSELDFTKYVGIIMIDGMSGAEENIMDRIGDLTNVNFIGGSAGDDLNFKETYVYANGKAYSNAAVMALIKPKVSFDILKTQSFCELDKRLIVTKADESNREVIEFNGKSASSAYAEAVGGNQENADEYFMKNPIGLMVDGEPYVRSPQQIKGDHIGFLL